MKRERLSDGHSDGLLPLDTLDLTRIGSFADLVQAMGSTSFGGRRLGRALDVTLAMTRDPRCGTVLTVSGAMTVAKQGLIICEMIERGLVQAIVATGALMAHGLSESIGLTHFACEPGADDRELYRKGYNRVYDTLELEANLNDLIKLIEQTLDPAAVPEAGWSSATICRRLGRRLEELDLGRGILRSAWRHDVPVFIPAFTDSELGLDLVTIAMARARRASDRALALEEFLSIVPPFNPYLDLQEYARLAAGHERLGIFTVGGGVPRNWAQQVAPYFEVLSERLGLQLSMPRFHYGVRICPEPVHWGGLSGCTYSEGVSWGKFVPESEGGQYAEVPADATLVWPLLMKAVCETLDAEARQ
jgi:deoxyhypusine synthase